MTDSPAQKVPLDKGEQPILDKLLEIRTGLELLKTDKSSYLKSTDVISIYEEIIAQVDALNKIREKKRTEQNRVDTVLDDCFQLISLSFMTIGKNHDAPAVYSAVSSVKRLLDHLKEAAFFSAKDLVSLDHRLKDYRDAVNRGKSSYDPHLLTLLEARIDVCQSTLAELQQMLSHLTPELSPTYEKLVSILRSLSACNTKSTCPMSEVKKWKEQLKEIEAKVHPTETSADDRSLTERYVEMMRNMSLEVNPIPSAEQLVEHLLARCLLWADIVEERKGKIDPRFEETYNKLLDIRNQLEKLSLTHAWSMRETDLYGYQRMLDRFDESRIDGNFFDAEGKPADLHDQRTLLYLLRKSYALIYHLLDASVPVSEALLPIYNQLNTLRTCLIEVKKAGGVSSPRELYPYSMKLNSIDNMRVDGKFMIGNDVPDGQAAVTGLLEDCFTLAYELRNQAEADEEDEEARPLELPKNAPAVEPTAS